MTEVSSGGGGRDRPVALAYPLTERLRLGAGYSLLGIGIGLALPAVYELGATVEQLGFAVREDGARQYWRPSVRS